MAKLSIRVRFASISHSLAQRHSDGILIGTFTTASWQCSDWSTFGSFGGGESAGPRAHLRPRRFVDASSHYSPRRSQHAICYTCGGYAIDSPYACCADDIQCSGNLGTKMVMRSATISSVSTPAPPECACATICDDCDAIRREVSCLFLAEFRSTPGFGGISQ